MTDGVTKYEKKGGKEILPMSMVMELAHSGDLKGYIETVTQSERERIYAFMRTFTSARKVAEYFGVASRTIERAVAKNRDIMDVAVLARNSVIGGLSEGVAIKVLRSLNVDKVPDEKKGKLLRDLMESAALAGQKVKPEKESEDESTMELVLRIKSRSKQPAPRPVDDDVIEGELVEPGQLAGSAP